MTSAQDRAETYLRLRAEAELRRVQALPRPDPALDAVPAPLRGAARLAVPFGRRAVAAMQPIAENAGRTLQPLADSAEQALAPLAQDALGALQPLAERVARALQPFAGQVIGAVLPAADEAARRLHPVAWQAAGRLQALQQSGTRRLTPLRWQASHVTASLRGGRGPDGWPERGELTPDEGLRRLRMVAGALADAGALDPGTADSIVDDMEMALTARARIDAHVLAMRELDSLQARRAAGPPAGPYLAVPAGVLVPASRDSGLAEVWLYALVIGPDRAALTVSGRLSDEHLRSRHLDPWPLFRDNRPIATDDRANRYELREDCGWSDEENWGGVLRLSPVPPAGTRWLELTMSPGSAPVRLDLAAGPGPEGDSPPALTPLASPAESMIDAAAMDLLQVAAGDGHSLPWHDLSGIADVVTALTAVGALDAAARVAAGRLTTLAGRLGLNVPPALSAAGPAGEHVDLPEAWSNVMENRHRRDGPRGVAPAAAVLPELDGARFVLAGLRSDEEGASLHVMAWGSRVVPHFLDDSAVRPRSWSARDDRGRWHVAGDANSSATDQHADLTLRLVPPLHPQATSLEVTVAGRTGQVTATVPLDWRTAR
jgi:hypothetical protein